MRVLSSFVSTRMLFGWSLNRFTFCTSPFTIVMLITKSMTITLFIISARKWRAAAALWGAAIWSSSRTGPAGMAQNRGEFKMLLRKPKLWFLGLGLLFLRLNPSHVLRLALKLFVRSPGSGPGKDIQRVISSHADAAKIGRKIADEVRTI